ncbi:MAG: glycosyltransferase [Phycisphaerales bacterium]|nr:MAG: glycosyltransferase [Phycisphaerales bacterium]
MEALPTVSVVIPTFNRASLLCEALDSVYAQTFTDYEVIVVDDGSTDGTPQMIERYNGRLRYIWQENRGAGEARNRGIAEARGEWIAFLDSDDMWHAEKLARCMEYAEREPETAIVFHPMVEIDGAGNRVRGRSKRARAGRIVDDLFGHCFVHTPTVVVRRRVLEEVGGFDGSLTVCEDYQLWLRIATRFPFHMVSEPLAFRRLHQKRLSKSAMYRNMAQRAEMLERFHDGLGGREALRPRRAVRRLARVFRAAGKANLRAKRYADAYTLFRRSLDYMPLDLRTRAYLWYTGLRRNSVMDRSSTVLKTAEEVSA